MSMSKNTQSEQVTKIYRGVRYAYEEWYHKDFCVDENTGIIAYQNKEKNYSINEVNHNLQASKKAYFIARKLIENQV